MVERFDYIDENELTYLLNDPDSTDSLVESKNLPTEIFQHPGFPKSPTHISLYEMCAKADSLSGADAPGFLSEEHSAETLAQLQVCLFAERRLMEIFIALGRGDPVSPLFNSHQLKHLAKDGFDPDAYAFAGAETAPSLIRTTEELFRLWCATNAKARNVGLSPDYLAAYTYDFMTVYEQIAYNFRPEALHENPFFSLEEAHPWLVNPLMMDPKRSHYIPSNTVRVYIDDVCILVPMGPIFYSYRKRVCYLNTFKHYDPLKNPTDKKYQMEVLLKTIAAIQMFQSMNVPLDLESNLNIKNFPNPKQLRKLKLKGVLTDNIPELWNSNKEAVRLRHLYPTHNFVREKGHNFLASAGLGPQDVDGFDIQELTELLRICIAETKKENQIIRERPDGGIVTRQKPKGPAKIDINGQKIKKKRKPKTNVFQAELPGLN